MVICRRATLLFIQAGFRIEHPQALIDRIQYREWAESVDRGRGKVPVADYTLAAQERGGSRSCFSFCMCPGGQVRSRAHFKDSDKTFYIVEVHRQEYIYRER